MTVWQHACALPLSEEAAAGLRSRCSCLYALLLVMCAILYTSLLTGVGLDSKGRWAALLVCTERVCSFVCMHASWERIGPGKCAWSMETSNLRVAVFAICPVRGRNTLQQQSTASKLVKFVMCPEPAWCGKEMMQLLASVFKM